MDGRAKNDVTGNLRLHGNPNWPGRGGNPDGKGNSKLARDGRKLFSEVLRQIYSGKGGPKKLKKLAMVCIEYAEAGHARFAELILDRLEGPVKHEPASVTNNFIFSEADRQRAESIVDDILAMDARTITLPQLPEEINGTEQDELRIPGTDAPNLGPASSASDSAE